MRINTINSIGWPDCMSDPLPQVKSKLKKLTNLKKKKMSLKRRGGRIIDNEDIEHIQNFSPLELNIFDQVDVYIETGDGKDIRYEMSDDTDSSNESFSYSEMAYQHKGESK